MGSNWKKLFFQCWQYLCPRKSGRSVKLEMRHVDVVEAGVDPEEWICYWLVIIWIRVRTQELDVIGKRKDELLMKWRLIVVQNPNVHMLSLICWSICCFYSSLSVFFLHCWWHDERRKIMNPRMEKVVQGWDRETFLQLLSMVSLCVLYIFYTFILIRDV